MAPLLSTLTIQTKDLTTERFPITGDFAWAQRPFLSEIERQYNAGKPVRVIVLKARQLGISTAMEAVLFWWAFLHKGTNGLVIAHENEQSEFLFEMTKRYWDHWPFKDIYTTRSATRRRLSWIETGSSLRVATAKNEGAGRGRTLHAVHMSECAFYPDPKALMAGLSKAIPQKHGTIVVLESTANGVGNWFYDEWHRAETGESDYVPLFFPWWKHPEYEMHTTLSTEIELDADEREILRLGATYENIEWRRWAIINLCSADEEEFHQEYPSFPEEAFVTSGNSVFPLRALDKCYEPQRGHNGYLLAENAEATKVRWKADPSGKSPLTIFKAPVKGDTREDRYFIAADPSMTVNGDPACIQVINRATMEQVAVWHGQIDPINFARELMMVGRFYNNAELCPEVEGGGQATIALILTSGYPNVWQHRWADKSPGKVSISYGWATNYSRKQWCIGVLKSLLADQTITIHDKRTYQQLRQYVVHNNGEWGPSDYKLHDDAVMAFAICVTASQTEGPFVEKQQTQNDKLIELFRPDDDGNETQWGAA